MLHYVERVAAAAAGTLMSPRIAPAAGHAAPAWPIPDDALGVAPRSGESAPDAPGSPHDAARSRPAAPSAADGPGVSTEPATREPRVLREETVRSGAAHTEARDRGDAPLADRSNVVLSRDGGAAARSSGLVTAASVSAPDLAPTSDPDPVVTTTPASEAAPHAAPDAKSRAPIRAAVPSALEPDGARPIATASRGPLARAPRAERPSRTADATPQPPPPLHIVPAPATWRLAASTTSAPPKTPADGALSRSVARAPRVAHEIERMPPGAAPSSSSTPASEASLPGERPAHQDDAFDAPRARVVADARIAHQPVSTRLPATTSSTSAEGSATPSQIRIGRIEVNVRGESFLAAPPTPSPRSSNALHGTFFERFRLGA